MSPFDAAWLVATIAIMAPLLLAASGEVVSQRSGVLNVGLEGFMVSGAFFGMCGAAYFDGSILLGILTGVSAGVATSAVMAMASISMKADQVVVGVGINLVAVGLTGFLFEEIPLNLSIAQPTPLQFPILTDLPLVGEALFGQKAPTYLAFAMVVLIWWVLFRTKLGIIIRGCGDYPSAVDTAGYNVGKLRFACVLFCGATAGAAGATLSVSEVGIFQDGMINGRGFLVLAAVILGRWHPFGIVAAAALFAGADSLQLRLQAQGSVPVSIWVILATSGLFSLWWGFRRNAKFLTITGGAIAIPSIILLITRPEVVLPFQFWRVLPFVVTLAVLLFFSGSSKGPAFLTRPYQRRD